eukprot:GCRY01003148.1.p1 GENE.GCRY01003148.1~~GCRY01003148.1.p1  ORF type:complete len:231 (+),score=28.39 GCRY01003148.1:121-813(+)
MVEISTPALLFPGITLLLLSYGNKFLGLASLIRGLADKYKQTGHHRFRKQVKNLKRRIYLIRNMQFLAIVSFFFCFCSMLFLLEDDSNWAGDALFVVAVVFMMMSLLLAAYETSVSVHSLDTELEYCKRLKAKDEESGESEVIVDLESENESGDNSPEQSSLHTPNSRTQLKAHSDSTEGRQPTTEEKGCIRERTVGGSEESRDLGAHALVSVNVSSSPDGEEAVAETGL